MDIEAIIAAFEIPIVERRLPENVRATIGDLAGRSAIILNRDWTFSSEAERRWVLAEELGHVLLAHRLVESTAPGTDRIGLLEWQRDQYEREAKAFAAELLIACPRALVRGVGVRTQPRASERVQGASDPQASSAIWSVSAMRVRLKELRLL